MGDLKVMRFDEMEGVWGGMMVRVRASLGVTSFGMQLLQLPPNFADYPEHDETASGQEEVYVPLEGSARLIAGGQQHTLEPGSMARVAPGLKRKIEPGADGLKVLVLGGVPGKAFRPPEWTEMGAPTPGG